MALPPIAVLRLASAPMPSGAAAVSPWTILTAQGETASSRAAIWAKVVSRPWPCTLEPVAAMKRPFPSRVTDALSHPWPQGST